MSALSMANVASAQKVWPLLPRPDAARVAEVAAWDTGRPVFFTPPFSDRDYWDSKRLANPARVPAAVVTAAMEILSTAESFASTPPPEVTEELYDQFLKTGDRLGFERPFALRIERLNALLFAEGIRGDGRFVPAIETEMTAIFEETAWSLSAHGHGRKTWKQARTNVELAATARAWSLATADYLLGDQLSPAIRERLRREVRERVVAPVLASLRAGGDTPFKWLVGDNNWNGVCTAGVLGAVLALSDDRQERATFIVAAENASPFYLSGFSEDGFCHEGLGYWSYGFGHYILGAELIRLATDGRLNLMDQPKAQRIAEFPHRWEIANGVYAAFGDAGVRQRTPVSINNFAAVRYGAGAFRTDVFSFLHNHGSGAHVYRPPFQLSLLDEYDAQTKSPTVATPGSNDGVSPATPLRDWFPEGGALVVRGFSAESPTRDATWGAAFKGGHNGQPHNHNDLGSFALVKNGVLVLIDPGMERYSRDSFSSKRYLAGLMNSFGHPVPRVAGQLQSVGPDARAVTLRSEFTDAKDLWEIDITSAYASNVPDLERITRTFIFTRPAVSENTQGQLEIIDSVKFRTPQSFGNALIIEPRQKYRVVSEEGSTITLQVYQGDQSVHVTINADSDAGLRVGEDPVFGVNPEGPRRATRIGFELGAPATEATIRTLITP